MSWYKPKAVRRVEILKPNGKPRPLGIPTIWDRMVQQSILQVLEPICEAKFNKHSYGFRPNRSTEHAIAKAYFRIHQNNQNVVRNQSNLSVNFTSATPRNGASIAKYEITFNGSSQTKTAASTINYGLVNSGNDLTLTAKVIDSRGNSTSISKTVTIFDWQPPNAVVTANRRNNYEDETYLKVSANISSVDNKNAIQSIKYRYKQTSSSTYSSYTTIQNNTQYTISINKLYAWDFQFVITDKFGSTTYKLTVAKGVSIVFVDTQKLSIDINKFPSGSNILETTNLSVGGENISFEEGSWTPSIRSRNGTNPTYVVQ